jgi:ankyrin repeat protein
MNSTILTKKVALPYSPEDPEIRKIGRKSINKAKLLEAAAKGCNLNILNLIEMGVDVHTPDHNGPDAPLRYACANGHPTTTKLLLDKGANPTIKRGLALKLATLSGSMETVGVLLSKKIEYPIDNHVPFEFSSSRTTYRMSKAILNYANGNK